MEGVGATDLALRFVVLSGNGVRGPSHFGGNGRSAGLMVLRDHATDRHPRHAFRCLPRPPRRHATVGRATGRLRERDASRADGNRFPRPTALRRPEVAQRGAVPGRPRERGVGRHAAPRMPSTWSFRRCPATDSPARRVIWAGALASCRRWGDRRPPTISAFTGTFPRRRILRCRWPRRRSDTARGSYPATDGRRVSGRCYRLADTIVQ